MRLTRRVWAGLLLSVLIGASTPSAVLAQDPTFGTPSATAGLGQPLSFSSTVSGVGTGTVEVLVGLVGREPKVVLPALPGGAPDTWGVTAELNVANSVECACHADGPSTPNTRIEYQFRVRAADGTTTLGPAGQITVNDDRFAWQTIEEDLVRVHWYERDEAFAHGAADVANEAIDRASALLGATLPAPVDLFIYSTQEALLEAVSPNRESIAGEAHSTIATMFVWIRPDESPDDSAVTVAHELTHLVFNEATDNDYHAPPRWLNEGIATYLSEGYSAEFQAIVNVSAQQGRLIPLAGLAGLFPARQDQFYLAYGESVAAVDYFVRTHTEQTLWDLVQSYRDGLSDDDAFEAATGADVAAFNAAWMGSLGVEVREPLGPQPAPPGPIPSGWGGEAQPTIVPPSADPGTTAGPIQTQQPGPTPGPGQTAAPQTAGPGATRSPVTSASPVQPTATPRPGTGTPAADDRTSTIVLVVLVGIAILFAILMLLVLVQRGRSRRPPPTPPQPPQPYTY